MSFLKLKRKGAPWWAPFFLVLITGSGGRAETVLPQKTETYRDIIDKAQTLSLQRERGHALQLLSSSMTKESKKGPPPKELVSALEEIAFLFLSDKAQQQYELALSLRANEPQMALQKLNEAAKLEPDNLQIQLEQFRVSSILGNCAEAANSVLKAYNSYPALEVLRLAAAQGALCQGNLRVAAEIRGGVDLKKSPFSLFWQNFDAELLYRQGRFEKAQETIATLQKATSQFPEAYYWQWRLEKEQQKSGEKPALKYVALCKAISARVYRQFQYDPFLCRRLPEVESSLKKNNNPSE